MANDITRIVENMTATLYAFFAKNDCFEIRIFSKSRGVVSGYFKINENGMDCFSKAVPPFVPSNSICFTLNPVSEECFERSPNQLTQYAKTTTKDNEISHINWLHIDLDPTRPVNTSATADEQEASRKLAKRIIKFLANFYGMENPVLSCSGNGYNIDYFLDGLPNTHENKALLKSVLHTINILFADKSTEIDLTTYNPSRVIKVFGCKSVKGSDTPERPHRVSFIESLPTECTAVSIESLQRLADISQSVWKKGRSKVMDVKKYLEKHNIAVNKVKDGSVAGSLMYILEDCPFNKEHTNKSALVIQFPDGKAIFKCHHASCVDKGINDLLAIYGNDDTKSDTKNDDDESGVVQKCVDSIEPNITEYFIDQNGEEYINIKYSDNINQNYRAGSKDMEKLIAYIYNITEGKIASPSLKKIVAEHFSAMAHFSGNSRKVEKRVNKDGDYFYYDLKNAKNQSVKIGADRVAIVDNKSILFSRTNNMIEQVEPDFTQSDMSLIDYVKKHFKIKGNGNILLFTINLLTCFIYGIAHPILVLHGEKGSSKSTTMKKMRLIIDPARNLIMSMPTNKGDLVSAISNAYLVCFDNIQKLTAEISELFCIVSTGGAVPKRMLYTDNDEKIIEIQRPMVLNGISIVLTQTDLIDRSIFIELKRIDKQSRLTEKEVMEEFLADLPKILGQCFLTISKAMALYGSAPLDRHSRMADFENWGYYLTQALGKDGQLFLDAYAENQKFANEYAVTADPLAEAVVAYMGKINKYEGTATDLYKKLYYTAESEKIDVKRGFPKSANALGKKLKEIKSNLEEMGIRYDTVPAKNHTTTIILENIPE